jgi:tetratricopeptide (TPR) repeat protein
LRGLLARAIALHQKGELPEAEHLYSAILEVRPDHFDAKHLLGVVRHQQGRDHEALDMIGSALKRNPGSAEALSNQGAVLQRLGRHEEALEVYDRALAIRPDYPEALGNRGNALLELRRCEEALASCDRALALQPDRIEALSTRSNVLRRLERFEEALASGDRALKLQPRDAAILNSRGIVLRELNKFEEALETYDRAIAIQPDHPEALNNRGNVLRQLKRYEEALESYDRALAIRPDYAEALNGRGGALLDLERYEEALTSYDRALALRPDYASPFNNRAKVLLELKRLDEALTSYDRALQLDPDNAEHRRNRALLLLLTGFFAEGWREYEWRRKIKQRGERTFDRPEWAGEDVSGGRLLLYSEQGLGDTIQFVRFARLTARRGARVILEVPAPLGGLLQRLDGHATIVRAGEPLSDFDRHLPLMSAPFILDWTPEQGTVEIPYLSADPARVDQWSRRLPAGVFRVGVAWQGNAAAPVDKGRSIPLTAFAPLGRIPGVRLISLQKGPGLEQMADLPPDMVVETLGTDFDSGPDAFLDTAAVMMHLDLIVTSDTAVAHLAGALGRPVWIVLKHVPDWRWMIDREDSPWYPTARLFRQQRAGNWEEVFARVADELAQVAANSETAPTGPAVDRPEIPGTVSVAVSVGELIDKLTILTIKSERIREPDQLANVHRELEILTEARSRFVAANPEIQRFEGELKRINEELWEIEDHIRDCERRADFGPAFIEFARAVYKTNDRRAAVKRRINEVSGSALVEEKSYSPPASRYWDHDELSRRLAHALAVHQQGAVAEAERLYLDILEAQADHFDATHLLGVVRHQQGRDLEALALIGRALKLNPRSPEALSNQGAVLQRLRRYEEALKSYDQVLAIRPDDVGAHHARGSVLKALGRLDEALASFDRALELGPENVAVLTSRGMVLRELGQFTEAVASYDQALARRPEDTDTLNNRGNVLWHLKRFEEALASYDQALAAQPDYAEALNGRGSALLELKRYEEALASYDRALVICPDYAEALNNRGNLLRQRKRFEEALVSYDRALAIRPDYIDALSNRGNTLQDLKRFEEARASYKRALALRPNDVGLLRGRGNALQKLDRFEEALASFDRALTLRPDDLDALNNRGNALQGLERYEEAFASYDQALAIRPDCHEALNGRGIILQRQQRFEEALANFDQALAILPDYPSALNNRGNALLSLQLFDKALASYDRALEVEPGNVDHRLNRALLLLLTSVFADGWREYEWRRKLKQWRERTLKGLEWAGEDVSGERVLLYSEQGLGDTIQFARFARSVARRDASVILEVPAPLGGLLERLDGDAIIVRADQPLPNFDWHLPLMSVPFIISWTAEEGAAEIAYLSADPVRVDQWSRRLPAGGFRVGVAWQGNPAAPIDKGRSIPLTAFAPLGRISGVRLISLQKGSGVKQLGDLPPGMAVEILGAEFDSGPDAFLDTAAVMMHLDLIVTSDSAVAHLAEALGRPVWIALKHVPDWRWMIDREDSAWYPTARLFRQRRPGDWNEVFERMAGELAQALAGNSLRASPTSRS